MCCQHLNIGRLHLKLRSLGNSLAIQWSGLCTFTAVSPGSIPGWGTKILQLHGTAKKKKKSSLLWKKMSIWPHICNKLEENTDCTFRRYVLPSLPQSSTLLIAVHTWRSSLLSPDSSSRHLEFPHLLIVSLISFLPLPTVMSFLCCALNVIV